MVTLAEILRLYGPAYRAKHQQQLLPSHLRAMWAIENCRTAALGGHIYRCISCDAVHYRYHSCRNRHCNQCESNKGAAWLQEREANLLPVQHHLVTFTLPSELRALAYQHQKAVYNLLFRAAAEALQTLAGDPRFVGGQIGMIGVLHTWQRNLHFHPHVHFLVPGGALDWVHERWHRAPNHFLVHVKPLMMRFRANLYRGLKRLGLHKEVDASLWRQPWVVHSQPAGYGPRALAYLSDYLFRVAISNTRIVKLEAGNVTFWHVDNRSKKRITCTLPVETFIRRFLMHVLPRGFVKVRYYGFYAAANRTRLQLAQELVGADRAEVGSEEAAEVAAAGVTVTDDTLLCPVCGSALILVGQLPRAISAAAGVIQRSRSPPGASSL